MKRAPQIKMTERELRVVKRRDMKAARAAIDTLLGDGFLHLPYDAVRELAACDNALDRAYKVLKPWWRKA